MTEGERVAERLRQLQETGSLESALGVSPNEGEDRSMLQRVGDGARRVALNTVAAPFGMAKQVLDYAEDNNVGLAGRTGIGALQGSSMGGLARLASGGETLDQAMQGNLLSGEERAANRERYRGVVEENSNVGGEIIGAIGTGGAVMRAGFEGAKRGVPALFNYLNRSLAGRTAAVSSMSALEAATYTLNEGGTLDDAQTSALYGAGFAVGGSALGHVIGPVFATVSNKVGYLTDREAARALLGSIRRSSVGEDALTVGARGEVLIDEDFLLAQKARFGPDASIADIVPDAVTNQVSKLLSDPRPEVYDAAMPLVRFLQNRQTTAQPEFAQAVRQIIDTDNYRTSAQVLQDSRATREQISQQYDAVLNRAEENGITFKATNVRKMINRAFRGYNVPATNDVRDHLLDMVGPETVTRGKGRNMREVPRELSAREMLIIRESMDSAIYTGNLNAIGQRQAQSNLTNVVRTQFMQPARDGLGRMMHGRVAGLTGVDRAYSSDAVLTASHEAGARLFRASVPDVAAIEVFLNDPNKTPMMLENFVEGVKSELFRKLDGKITPRQIQNVLNDNRAAFDALEAVLSPAQVDELKAAIERYSMAMNSGNMLRPPPAAIDPGKSVIGRIADWVIIGSGATGVGSTPALLGAARRESLSNLSPPGAAGRTAAISNLMTMPADQAARSANEQLTDALPTLLRYYPEFGAAYAAAGAQSGE